MSPQHHWRLDRAAGMYAHYDGQSLTGYRVELPSEATDLLEQDGFVAVFSGGESSIAFGTLEAAKACCESLYNLDLEMEAE
jgi:hypothetical protein